MLKNFASLWKRSITFKSAIIGALIGGMCTIAGSLITILGNNSSPFIQINIVHSDYPVGPASSVSTPVPTLENLPTITSVMTQQTQKGSKRYVIPIGGQTIIYSDTAPITIVGFGDFECPYTKKWNNEVLPKLIEHYPGKIRYIFRDFPLSRIHPNAFSAAIAANCGGEQGYYRSFYDRLFSGNYGLNPNSYIQLANDVGLNQSAFTECVNSERQIDKVNNEYEFASGLGVNLTPTFFVNGIALIGFQSFEIFQDVIDKELIGEHQK